MGSPGPQKVAPALWNRSILWFLIDSIKIHSNPDRNPGATTDHLGPKARSAICMRRSIAGKPIYHQWVNSIPIWYANCTAMGKRSTIDSWPTRFNNRCNCEFEIHGISSIGDHGYSAIGQKSELPVSAGRNRKRNDLRELEYVPPLRMNDPVALQVASRISGKPRGRPVWTSAGRLSAVSRPALKGRLSIQRWASLRAKLNRSFLAGLQFIVPETNHHGNEFSGPTTNDPTMRPDATWQVGSIYNLKNRSRLWKFQSTELNNTV